jgi:hypothetical protein
MGRRRGGRTRSSRGSRSSRSRSSRRTRHRARHRRRGRRGRGCGGLRRGSGGRRRCRGCRCGCRCYRNWPLGRRSRRGTGRRSRRCRGWSLGRRYGRGDRSGWPWRHGGGRGRLLGRRPTGDQSRTGALDRRGRHRGRRAHAAGCLGLDRSDLRPGDRLQVGARRLGIGWFGGHLLCCSLLRGRSLLGRCDRLFGLHRTAKAFSIGLPAGAVGLGVLDGRRMALDSHAQGQAQVKRFFVGQTELMCELVDPDLLRQRLLLPFLHVVGADTHRRPPILAHHRTEPSEPRAGFSPAGNPRAVRNCSNCESSTRLRNALSNAFRFTACSRHWGESRHNQAPLPGWVGPTTREPAPERATRTNRSGEPVRRHPTQVRIGTMACPPQPHPSCRHPPASRRTTPAGRPVR